MTPTYGYFYPENNQRFLAQLSFGSAEEAAAWWRDKRSMWQEIRAIEPNDKAAFMNPITGDIVVVREVEETV